MTEDLKKLRAILTNSIDKIIDICDKRGEEFPSLSEPARPSEFSPQGIRNDPGILEAIAFGVSAAAQLLATLQPPHVTLINSVTKFSLPATIGVTERTNVPEILREAGPQGLRVEEIAAKGNVDPKKLARMLRYLATNHIFKEVSPNVFANNLVSSCLDTGKSVKDIKSDPIAKFDNTLGVQAFASFLCDEPFRASAHLCDNTTDPSTAFSEEPNAAPMQRAFNTDVTFWEIEEKPENTHRFRRFGEAMNGTSATQPPAAILQGFDWDSVPQGGMLVDVGCGIGNVALEVTRARPDLRIVLEDRPQVIEKAKIYWKDAAPNAVASGLVKFNGFDFFSSRPSLPGDPSVFILRTILHDWPDKYSIKLLRNLRSLATPDTKLLVVDTIIDHACPVPSDKAFGVSGLEHMEAPAPLLANLGQTSILAYDVDMLMMINLNSSERTIVDFQTIFAESGWKLIEVRKIPGNKALWPSIIAIPV